MARCKTVKLNDVLQLCQIVREWDGLWQRSSTTLATMWAELLARWFQRFAPGSKLEFPTIQHGKQPVVALSIYHN